MGQIQGQNTSVEINSDNITKYFRNVFETKSDLLEMYVDKCENVDGPKTLANVETYGTSISENVKNYTIFYLFTWQNITDYYARGSQVLNFSASAVATYNTFCSENTSAAIVQLGGLEVYSTSKATAHIFGSTLPPKDLRRLNETFKRCTDPRSEKGKTDAPPTDGC
uniref:28 kDa Metastriate family member n=1 Tax=Rhipicephalus zambeziensis TaxID=60191 RepID=A0A224Y3B9_9ACAR